MELAMFVQNYVPNFMREGNPDAEHDVIMNDLEVMIAADKAGFKYALLPEHHFLDEYSHLSANDAFAGYLAHTTNYIHILSAIFNPLPQVNHPVKVAERVAMLDHISQGRFEFGSGRGAGSHEILAFLPGIEEMSGTKEIWEDVIREFPKMWMQDTYEGYKGKFWEMPARKILPKPWKKPHPPMWYACGNPASYEMCGRYGLGVLGFSVGSVADLEKICGVYKNAVANAEPIGAYVNDNILITTAAFVKPTHEEAVASAVAARANYLQSQVFRYHDTFPHPEGVPYWPELIPDFDAQAIEYMTAQGAIICGTPDEAVEQLRRWESAGADQVAFGTGMASQQDTLEMIELMGKYVIPKIDGNREHRTNLMRSAARV